MKLQDHAPREERRKRLRVTNMLGPAWCSGNVTLRAPAKRLLAMLALCRLTRVSSFKFTYNLTKLLKRIGWFTASAQRDYNSRSDPELVTTVFQVFYFPIVILEFLPVFAIADVN